MISVMTVLGLIIFVAASFLFGVALFLVRKVDRLLKDLEMGN